MKKPPLLHRLLKWAAVGALAVAVLVWPLKALLASQAQRVLVVARHLDEAPGNVARELFDPEGLSEREIREEVIGFYGSGHTEEDVLFIDDAKVVRPSEAPGLTLYLQTAGDNVFKMDSVIYATPLVSAGAAVTALLMFGLLAALRRRRSSAAATVSLA